MGSNARDNTYKNLLYSIHLLAPAQAFPQPMIQKKCHDSVAAFLIQPTSRV